MTFKSAVDGSGFNGSRFLWKVLMANVHIGTFVLSMIKFSLDLLIK